MKASEKEILFNLVKTASTHINGFTPEKFSHTPVFTDDKEIQTETTETPVQNLEEGKTTSAPMTLSDITNKITRCTRCALARTRTNTVPGVGVSNPEVMIIGEGPGADEDMQGEPFVGKAGQLLDKMLSSIKLDRHKNCYIANIVKCRPPNNRDPFKEEADACIGFLEAQIKILKPKMILCVGKVAAHNLLKNELSISQMRGNWYDYSGIPVLVTYHPSALLRDESYKKPAWEDLKQFARKLQEISETYSKLF